MPWTVLLLFLLALLLRLGYWILPGLDSDMAVTGLMALGILRGEFPIFFWGQPYCGTLEAFLAAPLFYAFGASRWTLNLVPLLESLVVLWLVYRLGKVSGGERVGRFALLFAAFSPVYITLHHVLPRANYVENLLLGGALLLVTHGMVTRPPEDPSQGRRAVVYGFLAGLAWWMNFQSISFILATAALLWIHDKRLPLRARFPAMAGAFLAGSLPFWIYNVQNDFLSLAVLRSGESGHWGRALVNLVWNGLPSVAGMKGDYSWRYPVAWLALVSGGLYLASGLWLFWEQRHRLTSLLRLSGQGLNGTTAATLFLAILLGVFITSGYGLTGTYRYLVPVSLVFPLGAALFTERLRSRFRVLAVGLVGIWILGFGVQNVLAWNVVNPQGRTQYFFEKRRLAQLLDTLERENVRHVYVWDYWLGPLLTFDAQERVVFAMAAWERHEPLTRRVDAALRVGYLLHGHEAPVFEALMAAAGGEYRKQRVADLVLYTGFRPPAAEVREILPRGWRVHASVNPEDAVFAIDRNVSTRWASQVRHGTGVRFQIDLGRFHDLAMISVLPGPPHDTPRGVRIETSTDGTRWERVGEYLNDGRPIFWSGPHPFTKVLNGRLEYRFRPRRTRYVRMTLTQRDPWYDWSLVEVFLYEAVAGQGGNAPPRPEARLREEGPVWTDVWLASRLPNPPRIRRVPVSGCWINEAFMDRRFLIRWKERPRFLVSPEHREALVDWLEQERIPFREARAGSMIRVLASSPQWPTGAPLARQGWHVVARPSGANAAAVDGELDTEWGTGRPQRAGDFFLVDMRRPVSVRRLRLVADRRGLMHPRHYRIEGSTDEKRWILLPLKPIPETAYWTGTHVLRCQGPALTLLGEGEMPQVRYLRIRLVAGAPVPWVIRELEVYGEREA